MSFGRAIGFGIAGLAGGPLLLVGGAWLVRHPGVVVVAGAVLLLAVVLPVLRWFAVHWWRARAHKTRWQVGYDREVDARARAALDVTERR